MDDAFKGFLYDIATKERERLFRLVVDAVYDILKEAGFNYGRKRIMNALLDNGLFENLRFKSSSDGRTVIPYIHPRAVIPVVDDIAIMDQFFVVGANDWVYGNIPKHISPSRAENFSVTEVLPLFQKALERDLRKVVGRNKYTIRIMKSKLKLSDLLSALIWAKGNKKKFGDRLEYMSSGEGYVIEIIKDPSSNVKLLVYYEPLFGEAKVIDNVISDRYTAGSKTYSRLSWKEALALVKDILKGSG